MDAIKIFLLEPTNKDQFDTVLIWSDNEPDARNNSGHFHPAGKKGETEPEDIQNLYFYNDSNNASCKELNENEYKIQKQENNKIHITFESNQYELTKNEPEIIGD